MNQTTYMPSWIVNLFHSFPHLNMWFTQTNSTFDPYNPEYLETILFWSTIPILLLILILLILIIYACCLVCSGNVTSNSMKEKENFHLCKLKSFVILFVVLLSASLAFIVYGSELFHYSYKDLNTNIKNFSNQFAQISEQTQSVRATIEQGLINNSLNKFEIELNSYKTKNLNEATVLKIKNEINKTKTALNQSLNAIDSLNQLIHEKNGYTSILKEIDLVEQTRWGIMIGIVTINLLLILLLVIGLIKNSKGSLCFFAFAGVLALISIWILNAMYLGITVFISDYCMNPDEYTIHISEKNYIKQIVVEYYTMCPKTPKQIPFQQELYKSQSKLNTAQTLYTDNIISLTSAVSKELIGKNNFTKIIDHTNRLLNNISTLIKCDQTSMNYKNMIKILCFNSIFGLAIVLLASLVFGLVLPILICIIPQLWRRINANVYRENGDEGHPFILPVNQSTRTNISAARQYNESPNFQRLHTDIHTDPYIKQQTTTLTHNNNHSNNLTAAVSPSYYMRTGTTRTITGI